MEWAPPAMDYEIAKRQHVELYGSVAVMNTYLKIALLCLSFVIVGLLVLNAKTNSELREVKPIIIRISDVGRAEALNYGSFEYHPQEAELKYFLGQFVQQYYGRMRATLRESYPHSLYFLESQLAEGLIEITRKTHMVETFLRDRAPEIDIQIKNVSIEDLRKAPYKATVQFDKVFLSDPEHFEVNRQHFVANFVFMIKGPSNALIPINPLGLTITYFREDQAFE